MEFIVAQDELMVLRQMSRSLEDVVEVCTRGPEDESDLWKIYHCQSLLEELFTYFDHRTKYLKSLAYSVFLSTFYWKLISEMKKEGVEWKCEQCGNWEDVTLDVHHTTYDHHGMEHRFMHELKVLCRDCHGKEQKRTEEWKKAH